MATVGGDLCNCCSIPWSWEENQRFEFYLTQFLDDTVDPWHFMANFMPGRIPLQLKLHYDKLLQELNEIWSGRVHLPWPLPEDNVQEHALVEEAVSTRPRAKPDKKKGVPWTEEEHRRFLHGLEKFGKGDWRSISRHAVVSRTPAQVASHAQKYFLRQATSEKERKRASIHDIRTKTEPVDCQSLQQELIQLG